MQSPAKADEDVPVLIAGGGGTGLTASMLLARLGVRHLLVSARPQTSDLPKAHVLNHSTFALLWWSAINDGRSWLRYGPGVGTRVIRSPAGAFLRGGLPGLGCEALHRGGIAQDV